jgi:hypothetical protein
MFLIFNYSEHSNKIPSRTPVTKLPFGLLHDFGEYFVEFGYGYFAAQFFFDG